MQYPTISSSTKEHIPRLDVVRAVAFLLVFSYHFGALSPTFFIRWNGWNLDYRNWPPVCWPFVWANWGWLGVALFFVLSGFCIHLSFLHQSGPFRIGNYYWRRFLRIYPAYFVSLIICFALMPWLPSVYKHFYQLPTHLFLVHNVSKSTFTGVNGVYWSLAVEAQFYLLYPLLLRAREKIGINGCLVAALFLNVLMQIHTSLTHHTLESAISVYWANPPETWCDWILGACLAEGFVEGRQIFRGGYISLLISFVFLAFALNFKPLSVQGFLFASVFAAIVMERYLIRRGHLNWLERLLIPVGIMSYSLYLWHAPAIFLLKDLTQWLGLPTTLKTIYLILLPLTILCLAPVAIISYRWIELGVPRWIRRHQKATPRELEAFADKTQA